MHVRPPRQPDLGHLDGGKGAGRLGGHQQAKPTRVLSPAEPLLLGGVHGHDRVQQLGTVGQAEQVVLEQ